jgi:D-arabinose 1-dehydrogenase-like Zn-dependent alcohol dehydrogenase
MKTLFFEKGQLLFKTLPQPSPQENEALIKVLKAGICNTAFALAQKPGAIKVLFTP